MGGGTTEPSEGNENIASQNASTGEGEFVVVERHEVNKTKDDACDDDAAGSTIETSSSPVPETENFVPGVFHAIGTRLSETSISSRPSTTSSGLVPNTAASPISSSDSAADEDSTDAAADFATQRDAAVAAITSATQAVLEFLYAYAVVVYHEGLAMVEQGADLVKDIRRKWRERGSVRPALRRLVRRKTGLVGLGVGLIVLVLVLSYWKMSSARDRAGSLSAQEWQEKYEAMITKQAFDSLRNRLKYEKLAGKHMELQAEYEALRDSLQTNDFPSGQSKVDSESCSNDAANGPVSAVKEALDAAEKSAYDMFKLFSDGLREDIRDITELKCGERDGICGGSCSSMEEKRGLLFRDADIAVDEEGGLQEDRSKDKKWEKRSGKGSKKGKKRGKYKKGSTKGEKVKIEGEKRSKKGQKATKKAEKVSTKSEKVKREGEKRSKKGQKVTKKGEKGSTKGEMKGGKQLKDTKKNRKYKEKGKELQSEQASPKLSRVGQIKGADMI